MKSRKFTLTDSTATADSAAKGLLLTRSSQGDVAANSVVRRFELRHNQSPRFARRRQERHKGQALLLAVLIMLLAALLSAGFLAVVSGNLNQSARVADKTRAIEASRAGIAYANAQLSGSSQGDLWRPIDVSPAPNTTDAAYNFYYSQLDKVQGWAAKTQPQRSDFVTGAVGDENFRQAQQNYRDTTYGKFPDPNQVAGDAPKFLVQVDELPTNPTAPDYEAEHAGQLKITSIGLSEDDPNVFHRAVAYKSGRLKSPWASALRSISNWKVGASEETTGIPNGQVNENVTANPSASVDVQINNLDRPQFSPDNVPFDVVIINKPGATVQGAVVTKVATTGNTTTLTLAKLDNDIVAGETIQKAAAIGTGSTIDLLNTGTTTPPTIEAAFPDYGQPNGILANGSLWLQNQAQLSNLGNNGTRLFTSGSLAIDDNNTATAKKLVMPSDIVGNPDTGNADSNKIVPSNVAYPGKNIVLTAAAISNEVKTTDFIEDGWNKIGSVKALGLEYIPDQTRTVKPFTPVQIDSAQNLARYRALTRNSANGFYIDNRDDVEKVGTALMSQAQLLNMLNSNATTATDFYLRNSTAGGASLEEKHLRGWVGPDEFLARGTLVELLQTTGNPFIRVTYDARSDTNPDGPDSNKTMRDTSGNLLPGVYSRVLPWPSNGTLFAEGNIRIRGSVNLPVPPTDGSPDLYPSLTVVSMNNIYIEGSLSVDSRMNGAAPASDRKKLMLLAKKNVIVNPTRLVLGHVDAQTATTAPVTIAVGANAALPVEVGDSSNFKVGDKVKVATTEGFITTITSATQIEVATNNATLIPVVVPADSPVVLAQWKDNYKDNYTQQASAFFKVNADNAINRRVLLPNAATNYPNLRLDLDHAGSRPATGTNPGLNVKTDAAASGKPADLSVKVTNKRVDANGTVDAHKPIIETTEKELRSIYNLPAPAGTDEFPDAATTMTFTDDTVAKTFSLKQLETVMNNTSHIETPTTPTSKGWKYQTTKETTLPDETPAFYLAAVGLRNDKFSSAAATADNGVKDIGPDGTEIDIPLATSVRLTRNGVDQNLIATYTGTIAEDGTDEVAEYTVPFLGFNPNFGIADPTNAVEDVLTVDQSFYQTDADVLKSTLDSRRFVSPTATGPEPIATGDSITLRQNDDLLGLAAGVTVPTLPDYRVRALKLENTKFPAPATTEALVIQPIDLNIDAYVYAQEGSWLVIPGEYFRTTVTGNDGNLIRSNSDGTASYIDFDNNGTPDTGEYIDADNSGDLSAGDFADLNRNGILDPGEVEAALRFVRYNYKVNFYGAIIENQTAVVADVKDAAGTNILAKGAVQDWMDKWVGYNNDNNNNGIDDDSTAEPDTNARNIPKWNFISYAYDPSLALTTPATNQLRVPVTDDLLYQQ